MPQPRRRPRAPAAAAAQRSGAPPPPMLLPLPHGLHASPQCSMQQQQEVQLDQERHHHQRPSATRRAVLLPAAAAAAAALLQLWPAQAARAAPIPGAGGNSAVLDSLRKMKKQERFEDSLGGEDPRAALVGRFEAVQGQLQKCVTLVKIKQYDSARMQLREKAFKSLRLDLAYGQEMYRLVSVKEAREVVEGVERLDGALKRREPIEAVAPLIDGLAGRLKAISEAAARIEEIS